MTGARPAATRRCDAFDGLLALALAQHQGEAIRPPLGAQDGAAGAQSDAVVEERALDDRRHLRVLAGKQAGRRLDDRHGGAEAAMGLGELDADRAAAEDEEVRAASRRDRTWCRW